MSDQPPASRPPLDHPQAPKVPPKVLGREPRVALPKRFYKAATFEQRPRGWAILLDGRAVKTPGRSDLILPGRELAQAVAAEWSARHTVIDPALMPLTRLANTALDLVRGRESEIIAQISAYATSDLLLYRAADQQALIEAQAQAWDPVIGWAHETFGVVFAVAKGIMPVTQQPETAANIGAGLARDDAFALCALHNITTLTGSALLALAIACGRLSPQDAWNCAHIDEDFQIARWGEDDQARLRRAHRWDQMQNASRLLALSTS